MKYANTDVLGQSSESPDLHPNKNLWEASKNYVQMISIQSDRDWTTLQKEKSKMFLSKARQTYSKRPATVIVKVKKTKKHENIIPLFPH